MIYLKRSNNEYKSGVLGIFRELQHPLLTFNTQYDLSPLPKRSRNAAICVRPTSDWKSTTSSITLSHHVELGVGDDEKGESSDDGVGARTALASAKKEHGAK